MEPISLTEQRRVRREAPGFARAVRRAKEVSGIAADPVPVLSCLTDFYDNPVLLYLSLWYADTHGVRVTFEPTADRKRSGSKSGAAGSKK